MEKSFGQGDLAISQYIEKLISPESDPIWTQVRQRAAFRDLPDIHVGRMDGLHLEVLTAAVGASKAVEIGTLAGYSGIRILRGMQKGKLFTFECSEVHAQVARENFILAGYQNRVEIFVGPAIENLPKIEIEGPFDLVFIDADKVNYPNYLDWADRNLCSGGVLIADNVFAWGWIAQNTASDPEDRAAVEALQTFNKKITANNNFRTTFLPTAEGLLFAVKN